jgi:uncharacterized protein
MTFVERFGPMAVIAGGSEGVGAAYAMELAARGLDLALVARKPGPLEEVAAQVRAAHPARTVLTRSVDLSQLQAGREVLDLTAGHVVGLLVYNAGASARSGDFLAGDPDFPQALAAVNVTTMMALAHGFGGPMQARGRGGIILMSSFASLVGNPGLAAYSAAKAYVNTFGEALWHELRPHGVAVLTHVLGMTDTPANARNYPGMGGMGDRPEDIAMQALAALEQEAGPVLYAGGGGDMARALGAMDRAMAVEQMVQAGAAFRD